MNLLTKSASILLRNNLSVNFKRSKNLGQLKIKYFSLSEPYSRITNTTLFSTSTYKLRLVNELYIHNLQRMVECM